MSKSISYKVTQTDNKTVIKLNFNGISQNTQMATCHCKRIMIFKFKRQNHFIERKYKLNDFLKERPML